MRLDKLREEPGRSAGRDAQRMAELAPLEQAWRRETIARAKAGGSVDAPELEQFGWLLEELRVSLFAQELKTPVPVSAKRLAKLWQSMRK
jgi:ATP-dependent helicase HrpA